LKNLFGTYSERQINKIKKVVDDIEGLADKYANMSDEELSEMTLTLKEKLESGETLDNILPDAFALVREADTRVLGKRPYRVQLIGGIILHEGKIAEMKTGEGRTLVETMPAYLNALSGEGVHIVTVNEYLANRDRNEMGKVFEFLGLTTGLVLRSQSEAEKKQAYAADITYGVCSEYGFNYLYDNMAIYKESVVQRGHSYAIVDEVDSVLIDEARTPLIISGREEKSDDTENYRLANEFVRTLKKFVIKELDSKKEIVYGKPEDDKDTSMSLSEKIYIDPSYGYVVNEKDRNVTLAPTGAQKAEAFYNIENLYDSENAAILTFVNSAIKAYGIMQRDVDYTVNENGVVIIDNFTGRLMYGRRYQGGLHQAIEAKENIKTKNETKTCATITIQNYFRLYKKLSGMTGTALTEADEFGEIYGMDVIEIPTNKPMIRINHRDAVFLTANGKYKAIVEQVKECYKSGQPILVGTASVEKSELFSNLLKKEGIPHEVLNAKRHAQEAYIIGKAGMVGKVTIATNMAGRGTDIMLGGDPEKLAKEEMIKNGVDENLIAQLTGSTEATDSDLEAARRIYYNLYEKYKTEIEPNAEKVKELGGLYILGSERHESRRIDNQLRGRSGRQGDPGQSKFFISFEDDLIRLYGGDRMATVAASIVKGKNFPEETPIEFKALSNSIEKAQERMEGRNFAARKRVLEYDNIINQQREVIYQQRGEVLNGSDISGTVQNMIKSTVINNAEMYLQGESPAEWNITGLKGDLLGFVLHEGDLEFSDEEIKKVKKSDIIDLITERSIEKYHEKEEIFTPERFREIERIILLQNVDTKWIDYIDAAEDLKDSVMLQAYAQRDPITEYKIQSSELFDSMVEEIRFDTTKKIFMATPLRARSERAVTITPTQLGAKDKPTRGRSNEGSVPIRKTKIGRNDLCPCGSGKKYKNCCGKAQSTEE